MNQSANDSSNLPSVTLVVPGMGSDHCAGIVRESIERLHGIESISTSISSHKAKVAFDPDSVDPENIRRAVEKAGYEVSAVFGTGSSSEVRLTVPGMGSDHCAGLVRNSLERLDGIDEIRTNISNHQVSIRRSGDSPSPEELKAAVERGGYEVTAVRTNDDAEEKDDGNEAYLTRAWRRFVIAAVPTTLIMILMMVHMFWTPVPGYLAIVALLAFRWCFSMVAGPHMFRPGAR